jgi:hypothetical protein
VKRPGSPVPAPATRPNVAALAPLPGFAGWFAGFGTKPATSPVTATPKKDGGDATAAGAPPKGALPVPDAEEAETLACPGPPGISALSVLHSKPILYGTFVWMRMAFNGQKRRFPVRVVGAKLAGLSARAAIRIHAAARRGGCARALAKRRGSAAVIQAAVRVAQTVRVRSGRLGGPSVSHSKSGLYGAYEWTHRALNSRKRLFPGPGRYDATARRRSSRRSSGARRPCGASAAPHGWPRPSKGLHGPGRPPAPGRRQSSKRPSAGRRSSDDARVRPRQLACRHPPTGRRGNGQRAAPRRGAATRIAAAARGVLAWGAFTARKAATATICRHFLRPVFRARLVQRSVLSGPQQLEAVVRKWVQMARLVEGYNLH